MCEVKTRVWVPKNPVKLNKAVSPSSLDYARYPVKSQF